MKIKFIAAPLVAGALMVPATLSTPAAQAAIPTIPAVSSNTADAHKLLEGVNGRITSLNDDLKVAKASLSPMEVIDTIADLLNPRLRLPFRLFPPCQVTLQTHTSCSRVSTVVSRRSTTI